MISAQSGEAVLTAFHKVAAALAGVQLSAAELEQTKRILGVSVVRGEEEHEELSEEARKIMEEDARLEAEKKRRAERKGCCCVQ